MHRNHDRARQNGGFRDVVIEGIRGLMPSITVSRRQVTSIVGMPGVTWVEWLFIEAVINAMLTPCDQRDYASKDLDLVRCAHGTFY